MTSRRPPPVREDGRVALVAPGVPVSARRTALAATRLRSVFGLTTTRYPTARRSPADGPAPPAERAEELMRAFSDPAVDAVFAVADGGPAARVVSHLDEGRLRRHPTRLFGTGRVDAVRLFLWRLGVVSWGVSAHPALTREAGVDGRLRDGLSRALFGRLGDVTSPTASADGDDGRRSLGDETASRSGWRWRDRGTVAGPVWGGRLGVVRRELCAARLSPAPERLEGAVLALSAGGALPPGTAVTRLLGALGRRGWLTRVDGLLLARPPGGETPAVSTVFEAAERQLARHAPDTTLLAGVAFGGSTPAVPLPLGATARLVPDTGGLVFE
ncbi:LD-carboxypeptidase [Halobaculum sp. MBLA0143]|uniref:LD-carboxypeptidase n=1 Tax=Halobaculum sp. MBLA0143 TaxID=3079933 RepID=UPI0035253D83